MDPETLSKPCAVCNALPNEPCWNILCVCGQEQCYHDGTDRYACTEFRFASKIASRCAHGARIFGPGPILVRHTGEFDAEGGAILEFIGDKE
jgi:hypothetical protein